MKPFLIEMNMITLFGLVVVQFIFIRFYIQNKKQKIRLEQEKTYIQLYYSQLLIDTLACTHREFRNRLQVIITMGSTGEAENVKDYILGVAAVLTRFEFHHTENPLLNAAIKSQKILAREKKINLLVKSSASFRGYSSPNFYLITEMIPRLNLGTSMT